MTRSLPLLVLFLLISGCTSPASTKDEFLAGTADTAYAVKEGGETVFWRFPKFLLWTVPKAVVYDLPRSVVLALRGDRARVEDLVTTLESENVTMEDEVAISEELREITGIPIHSAARWRTWWKDNESRPEGEWLQEFVDAAIEDLTADRYFTRATAIEDLKAIYGTDLGYDPKGSPDSIREGANRFRAHLAENGVP